MDVTLVNVQMEILIVLMKNVLFVGTMIIPTKIKKNGRMDVLIVIVIEVLPSVLILVLVQVMKIVKKDITVTNPLVMIPQVLVSNVLMRTVVYPPQFVVVMIKTIQIQLKQQKTMLL
jgi:hypothetical protein